jgi:excisionase family DNA binding protein
MSSNNSTHVPKPTLVLTAKEAYELLQISRTTLWKLVKQKKLKTCSFGGRRRLFSRETLEQFVRDNQR